MLCFRVTGNEEVVFRPLDLASFSSIRDFAASMLREESHIDLLVNNAGVFMMPLRRSQDGVEMHLAINYLGHFLLTQLYTPGQTEGGSKCSCGECGSRHSIMAGQH